LEGFNEDLIQSYLKISDIRMIVSGGVRDSEDLEKISRLKSNNIFGVILGKSLYENRINFSNCIKVYQDVS